MQKKTFIDCLTKDLHLSFVFEFVFSKERGVGVPGMEGSQGAEVLS